MGGEKGLVKLGGKPLIAHVIERLEPVVNEVILVVGSEAQIEAYSRFGARVVVDKIRGDTPLKGAYTGFSEAKGEYCFLTGADQPLLNWKVVGLLFEAAEGHAAATPYWPNGWVEPLHAVYLSKESTECSKFLLESGVKRLSAILRCLGDVERVPMDEIRHLDPELRTFMDVDTEGELRRVEALYLNKI
jgi:molybdopterin-guanine dinucleotide biosynthesis protein A